MTYEELLKTEYLESTDNIYHLLPELTGISYYDIVVDSEYKPCSWVNLVTYAHKPCDEYQKWEEKLSILFYHGLPVAVVESFGKYGDSYLVKTFDKITYNNMVNELKNLYYDGEDYPVEINLTDEYEGSLHDYMVNEEN